MSFINHETRHIVATVVWYGAAGCGKTATIQHVFARTRSPDAQTLQIDVPPGADPASYEFIPFELGKIRDYGITLRLFTVPGAPQYSVERRALLEHIDGVVFVADTRPDRQQESHTSLGELYDHLSAWGNPLERLPLVLQCTFGDTPGALPSRQVATALIGGLSNAASVPVIDSNPPQGTGVFEALKAISKMILSELRKG
jgi:signal recognition particle receptor subunit beta